MFVSPFMAKFMAFCSACGFIVSVFGYIYSFLGIEVNNLLRGLLVLLPVWIVPFLPMFVLEYPESKKASFCFKGFTQGMPNWVAPCSWFLQLAMVAHFIWLSMQSGAGLPEVLDGQYVLAARGRILRLLTQTEDLALMNAELRFVATMVSSLYFVTTMYWWLRRGRLQPDQISGA